MQTTTNNKIIQPSLPRKEKTDWFPYLISIPALLLLCIGMVYPMLWSLYYSFTDKRVATDAVYIGFENYKNLISDQTFLRAISNTIYFTLGSMVGKVIFGVIIALILNMNIKFRNALRTLFLLPWTLPSVVAIYTWLWLYSGNGGGLINNLLLQSHILKKGIGWLSNPKMAIVSLMIVNTWRGIPFIALTVLSGLQTIPTYLYESASIDGASTLQSFFRITVPLIVPVVLVSTLISTIWTINDFETVYLLTGGGPGQSTYTIPIAAYKYAFDAALGNIGKASAAAFSTVPALVLLMIPIMRNMLGDEEKERNKELRKIRRLERKTAKERVMG